MPLSDRDNPTEPTLFGDTPFAGLKALEPMCRFLTPDERKAVVADLAGICALLRALGITKELIAKTGVGELTPTAMNAIVGYLTCEKSLYEDVKAYLDRPDDDNLARLSRRMKGLDNMRSHAGERKGYAKAGR